MVLAFGSEQWREERDRLVQDPSLKCLKTTHTEPKGCVCVCMRKSGRDRTREATLCIEDFRHGHSWFVCGCFVRRENFHTEMWVCWVC